MMPEVTYGDYQGMGYEADEETFLASLPHALERVSLLMGYHEPNPDWPWQVEAYKRAVCAAVTVDIDHGGNGGLNSGRGGFTIGSFSSGGGGVTSSVTDEYTAYDADMSRAVRGALAKSGLLCQIVR